MRIADCRQRMTGQIHSRSVHPCRRCCSAVTKDSTTGRRESSSPELLMILHQLPGDCLQRITAMQGRKRISRLQERWVPTDSKTTSIPITETSSELLPKSTCHTASIRALSDSLALSAVKLRRAHSSTVVRCSMRLD